MRIFKDKDKVKLLLLMIMLVMLIYNITLQYKLNRISASTIKIRQIESFFITSLKSFENKNMNDINSEIFNTALLYNSYDLQRFQTLCEILIKNGDVNIYELKNTVYNYYYYLSILNTKVINGKKLTDEEIGVYRKIYFNMNLINSKIQDEVNRNGEFKDLSKFYTNIKNQMQAIEVTK